MDYCGVGCQFSFGICLSGSGSILIGGKCGFNGKMCVGLVFGNCCLVIGNCGGIVSYCG